MTRAFPSQQPARPLVAIVDDEADVRSGLDRFIRSLGLDTKQYANGEAVLEDAALLSAVICLVSDIQMPRMSGLELQAALRARNYTFPVIFVTAYPDEALQARALAQGAFAYFGKPFDTEIFTETLRRAIGMEENSSRHDTYGQISGPKCK